MVGCVKLHPERAHRVRWKFIFRLLFFEQLARNHALISDRWFYPVARRYTDSFPSRNEFPRSAAKISLIYFVMSVYTCAHFRLLFTVRTKRVHFARDSIFRVRKLNTWNSPRKSENSFWYTILRDACSSQVNKNLLKNKMDSATFWSLTALLMLRSAWVIFSRLLDKEKKTSLFFLFSLCCFYIFRF